jgi:hypothetical protein
MNSLSDDSDVTINDSLLAYTMFSLQTGTADNVKKAVLGFFTPDQIARSKDILWNKVDNCTIIGKKMARKTSNQRKKEERI